MGKSLIEHSLFSFDKLSDLMSNIDFLPEYLDWLKSPYTTQLIQVIKAYQQRSIRSNSDQPLVQFGKAQAAEEILLAIQKNHHAI